MTSRRAKIFSRFRSPSWALLSGSALTTGVLPAVPALAQTNPCPIDCPVQVIGEAQYDSQLRPVPIGENTEAESLADAGSIPFMISVDGDTVEESAVLDRPVDEQRRTDLSLNAVDIGVKFDGLDAQPVLNVVTEPRQAGYQAGDTISFATHANYPGFIARAEIRIHDHRAGPGAAPIAIVPVAINGRAQWTVPAEAERFGYVLRVYDDRGAYDETLPAPLVQAPAGPDASGRLETPELYEDRTDIRNISVYGGAVTVYGRNVPAGYGVKALGETIAVDADQAFVVKRILPGGDHAVDVALVGEGGKSALQFTRVINIPHDDWFYVALADVTVGARTGDDMIEAVRPGEYDEVWSTGRLAFYLKGKIRGEYLLTAAADTGEEGLGHLFDRMGERNPRDLLRGLDPDKYYPVYGDDSTIVQDAPTNGRFYLRLERGDSHVMWGNYQTAIEGTEFLRSDRTLYGANAVYRSDETTSFGERRTQATLYAALPDTLPQREEFLGTGGSAYFLRRQDVTVGSETLTVEMRDAVSGRVVQRRVLQYGVDYSIDYLQGVIILKSPLAWMTGTNGPVRDGAIGGKKIVLVAQYEFVPTAGDLDGYAYGGRLRHWFGDHVRIGATGMSETTGPADQTGIGADIALRYSQTSFIEAEIARSEGPGFGLSHSVDGGLSWGEDGTAGVANRSAIAWRLAGQIDLADLGVNGTQGTVGAYYESKEQGFSTLTQQIHTDQWLWGLDADIAFENGVELVAGYDDLKDGEGQIKRNGDLSLAFRPDPYWKVSAGVNYTELMSPRAIASGQSGYDGSRLDAGVRIEYEWAEGTILHAFGQATLATSGDIDRNDRTGVGAQVQLTDTIGLTGEVSYGTHGLGALFGATYDPNADEHYYMGYRLDPGRAFDIGEAFDLIGDDGGTLVFGHKRRLDEIASAYTENSYDMYGNKRSLTQTYGVLLTPDSLWTVDLGLVAGRIEDSTTDPITGLERADFNRYAPSLAISYVDESEGVAAHARGEVRIEESSDGTRNQNIYLFATGLSWQVSDDWRLLADFDGVFSDSTSDNSAFINTEYAEASIGYAYRPVEHDRLNALFRYTWLYDRPGGNQLISGVSGDSLAPAQRSHVLSLDVNYDLMPWLTIGGKYGFRYGKVLNRAADGARFVDEWHQSSAHLGVLRADLHVVKNWDLLLEGRVLNMPEAETTDYGALAAVYHHLGDNFKVGLGYNFGSFSDDLRDLTLNDRGMFLNVVGKF